MMMMTIHTTTTTTITNNNNNNNNNNNFIMYSVVSQFFIALVVARGEGGEATRPGTEKRCSHSLQSDPLGNGFKKGRENFPL